MAAAPLTWNQALAKYNPTGAALGVDGTTPTNTGLSLGGGQYLATSQPGAPAGGGGTAITQGVNDPNTIAGYGQGIDQTNAQINRLGAQQASGNQALDTSFTNALNQLLLGKNQANATYSTNKQQAGTDYVGAKNTIGTNAGNTLRGLQRLLGSRGAGGGSAYNISAPGAVAGQATQQRQGASNTFGANNQALDTNWNDYLTGYNNQVSSATNQRDLGRQNLQQQIDNNRASLLQSLAQLSGQRAAATGGSSTAAAQPYLNQANALLDRTANYTTAPITYQTQAYTAPSLASYSTNPTAAPTYQGQPATNDYTTPYLAGLLGKKQPTNVTA